MTLRKRSALGSIINDLRYRSKKTHNNKYEYQHDINTVVKRLEGYKKYQMQLAKENKLIKQKERRNLEKKFRRKVKKMIHTTKPVHNPYMNIHKNMLTGIDPKLLERYRYKNAYGLREFRHVKLPKSNYQIDAGQAWGALVKAWDGFYTARRFKDSKKTILYASAVQKFCDMLDLELPDFPTIGLSKTGYSSAKIMKEFYNSEEIIGDEELSP